MLKWHLRKDEIQGILRQREDYSQIVEEDLPPAVYKNIPNHTNSYNKLYLNRLKFLQLPTQLCSVTMHLCDHAVVWPFSEPLFLKQEFSS